MGFFFWNTAYTKVLIKTLLATDAKSNIILY